MSTAEEPVTPPADVETPAEGAAAPTDTTPAEPEVKAEPAPAEPQDIMALLSAEFGEDPSGDVAAEEASKVLTADMLKGADPALRVAFRTLLKRQKADEEKRAAEVDARMKAAEAKEAAAIAAEKRATQLRAAALRSAGKAPDPGAPPKVDLLTEEGISAQLDYLAKKAAYDATAPARAELDEITNNQAWIDLCETYPLLKDPKIGGEGGEFDTFFGEFTKDFDLSKMPAPQRAALVTNAARLFTAERDAAKVAEQVRRDAASKARAQAASASAIGRSAGSGGPDPLAYVLQLEKSGDKKALYAHLAANPKAREAYDNYLRN